MWYCISCYAIFLSVLAYVWSKRNCFVYVFFFFFSFFFFTLYKWKYLDGMVCVCDLFSSRVSDQMYTVLLMPVDEDITHGAVCPFVVHSR